MSDTPDKPDTPEDQQTDSEAVLHSRRAFLLGLGKWSQAVIAGVVLGSTLSHEASADGFGWINRRGGWINGGGGWINGGGSWINGEHGGWVNRRGGAGWINRRD